MFLVVNTRSYNVYFTTQKYWLTESKAMFRRPEQPMLNMTYPCKRQRVEDSITADGENAKTAKNGWHAKHIKKLPIKMFRKNVNLLCRKSPPCITARMQIRLVTDPMIDIQTENTCCSVLLICTSFSSYELIVVSGLIYKTDNQFEKKNLDR